MQAIKVSDVVTFYQAFISHPIASQVHCHKEYWSSLNLQDNCKRVVFVSDLCLNYCGDHGVCDYGVKGEPYCNCATGYLGSQCNDKGNYAFLCPNFFSSCTSFGAGRLDDQI